MILRSLVLLFTFFGGCTNATEITTKKSTLKILFVGNSLTYTNDLPQLVQEMGKHDSVSIEYTTFLFPNYSLEDHWNEGKVQKEIETGRYDFVVAQQGPSALPESQVLLLEYARRLAEVCQKNNASMAIYMVWPSSTRFLDLDNVIYSYTQAAKQTQSLLCPAGLAWKYAWQSTPSLPLYGNDNFHPSMTGSLLAAFTVYGTLTHKANFDFLTTAKPSWSNEISVKNLELLKQAALKAMEK
ncbi:SGNH/GDSL hydrolase family protein [Runella aurantiaca]|uniref:SGNH/GDSL hydrolase family protein n=1 Tax=Runella aurantiaca TaxID=2282308 RepID=A0A369I8N6_9BACT|nr:SGNH/GDSL hydrolase family protein [Runella aurantiaca]RDB05432.1 SGNH/GDSL hydrolase family protein [Runella aurantiaca]